MNGAAFLFVGIVFLALPAFAGGVVWFGGKRTGNRAMMWAGGFLAVAFGSLGLWLAVGVLTPVKTHETIRDVVVGVSAIVVGGLALRKWLTRSATGRRWWDSG